MPKSVPQYQIRALAMATIGAAVAAVAMMFVPVGILENFTGSTGLSELVPAARAPLGDTARALIAFGAGAFTLAVLAFMLTRQDRPSTSRISQPVPASEWAAEDQPLSLIQRIFGQIKMPILTMPKMPWNKGESDITELGDLPKLRNGDSHPDAPPRRPLVASQDLPVLEMSELADAPVEEVPEVESAPVAPEAVADVKPEAPEPQSPPKVVAADIEPTLADMVAQLEAAVAERQRQLSELEAVATNLAKPRPTPRPMSAPEHSRSAVDVIDRKEIFVESARAERPTLEAVPNQVVKDDDMDSALAAALATLHRMNATGR